MDTLEREKEIDLLERECCPFKEGDEYWGLNSDGSVSKLTWDNHSIDQSVLMLGNAFSTSKEAILEADRRVLLHRFKMFRDKYNDGWEPDWTDDGEGHFYIYYDYEFEEMKVYTDCGTEKGFQLFGYFEYEEYCEKAIELFGDEIKKLYID